MTCWKLGTRGRRAENATAGIPSLCKNSLTWAGIAVKTSADLLLERKMIEMMYVFQDEYMCRRCSRVKKFASAIQIADPKFDHPFEGAATPCPFCEARTAPEVVQGRHRTLSSVY